MRTYMNVAGEIFTSEKSGCDESGDGSEGKPFKTVLQAMRHAGKEPFPAIYVDSKEEGKVNNFLDHEFWHLKLKIINSTLKLKKKLKNILF